jgi:hypothetical protein
MTSQRDRVQSLESRIEELEATVRGLTEELVDANQRIRDLEEAAETQPTDAERSRAGGASEGEEAKTDESEKANETDDEGGSGLGDDIIVA